MRVIIVGCGRVGAGLASRLAEEGHDVVILDVRTESFRRLAPAFSGQALRGDGTDASVLERAGAPDCEWFFALTNGDNRNILAAQLARETFDIPHVLCKINDPVRSRAYATLGIDTINRTDMMLDSIGRYMGTTGLPGAADVNVAAVPVKAPRDAAGRRGGADTDAADAAAAPGAAAAADPPAEASPATAGSSADKDGGR
jgi:trk/ktr system potassium uptake protein